MDTESDFLDAIEQELIAERRALSRHVDRADALVVLRVHALRVANDLQRPITVKDMVGAAGGELARAELFSLFDRITGDQGGEPAFESAEQRDHPKETGAGF